MDLLLVQISWAKQKLFGRGQKAKLYMYVLKCYFQSKSFGPVQNNFEPIEGPGISGHKCLIFFGTISYKKGHFQKLKLSMSKSYFFCFWLGNLGLFVPFIFNNLISKFDVPVSVDQMNHTKFLIPNSKKSMFRVF